MSLLQRLPLGYFIYIPSVYFALLGTYDIVFDLVAGSISIEHLIFNLVLFLPLAVRRWYMLLGCGVVFGVFWTYLLIAGSFLMVDRAVFARKPLEALALWLFLLASVLRSMMLFHAGSRMKAALSISHRLS